MSTQKMYPIYLNYDFATEPVGQVLIFRDLPEIALQAGAIIPTLKGTVGEPEGEWEVTNFGLVLRTSVSTEPFESLNDRKRRLKEAGIQQGEAQA